MQSRDLLDNARANICTRKFVLLWSVLTGLYVFGWATKWTFDPATVGQFWPGRYFTAQADALLHGRLWVRQSDIPGECYFSADHCYGYYGLTPSLLRLPLVILAGSSVPEFTPMFVSVAAGISTWSALDLCRRVLQRGVSSDPKAASTYLMLASIVLGPGSALILLSDPYVYQESILWSVAGILVGTNLLWRWWNERARWQYIGAVVAYTLAAGSRPTSILVGTSFIVCTVWTARRHLHLNRQNIVRMLSLAALPAVFACGVFLVKFGSPLPSYDVYEQRHNAVVTTLVEKNNGSLTGPRFTPTFLAAFLRPDSLKFNHDWPWVRFRFGWPSQDLRRITYLPPLRNDSMYVEKTVSLTNIMPLAVLATLCMLYSLVRRRRWSIEFVILISLCTIPLLASMQFALSSRYLGDWYPLVSVGTAFFALMMPRLSSINRQSHNLLLLTASLVSFATLVAAPLLASQYNWIYLYGSK